MMIKRFVKEVVGDLVGRPAENIVDLLDSKKYINEFIIAKKLDLTINQIRNILYKISDYGLVSSLRKKDKKKGWYTYFWKIEELKSLEFLKTNLLKQLEQISTQIKNRETKQFYICEKCNVELNEETALLQEFTCNECGEIFTLKDNQKLLKDMKKNLDIAKEKLKLVEDEIEKEKEKQGKEKEKVLKKEQKEKDKKKAEVLLKRKIEREKLKKLNAPKKSEKKKPLKPSKKINPKSKTKKHR
jgi:transcription factor E